MDIKYYNDPWEHAIVDNFFPDHIFKELLEQQGKFTLLFKQTYNTSKSHMAWVQDQNKNSKSINSLEDKLFIEYSKQFPELTECYENLHKFFTENHDKYVNELYNTFKNSSEYPKGFKFAIQIQANNYRFKIHPDTSWKMMSTTVFLSEQNVGTWLYKTKDQNYHEPDKKVEWKPNRALVFVRSDETFHSFHTTPEKKFRYTLAYNLTDGTE